MAIILLDTLANTLCLLMALRMAGRRARPDRVLAAALFGALAAKAVRMAGVSRGAQALLWLPLALAMTAAADGRVRLRTALLLLSGEGLLGGTVYALCGALGSMRAAWCVGAVFASVMSASALRARRAARDVCTARIRVTTGTHTAAFDALVDSGNCLRDYLTGRPVIVLSEAAKRTLGLEDTPLRPIFADTAGGRQMMDCFTPKEVHVILHGRSAQVSACAAFSPGLSGDAPALLPQSLLEGEGEI